MFATLATCADGRWRIIPQLRRGQRLDRRPAPGAGWPSPPQWFNGLKKAEWVFVIAAYILIQTEAGKAAIVAAALRALPGVSETASLAGPYDVIARAQAGNIDELARLVTSQVQALDGVSRTMSCPVVRL
jgi:DNA-binding Lrp family transcriptional regulator